MYQLPIQYDLCIIMFHFSINYYTSNAHAFWSQYYYLYFVSVMCIVCLTAQMHACYVYCIWSMPRLRPEILSGSINAWNSWWWHPFFEVNNIGISYGCTGGGSQLRTSFWNSRSRRINTLSQVSEEFVTTVCHKVFRAKLHLFLNVQTIKPLKDCLKTAKLLTLFSLNCRSVKNKALSIADLVASRNIYILALTETWPGTCIDAQVLSELVPPGYDILHVASPDKRGGGVAVLFREELVLNIIQSNKSGIFTQFEHIELSVIAGKTHLLLDRIASKLRCF